MKKYLFLFVVLFSCNKEKDQSICKTCVTTGTVILPNHKQITYEKSLTITMNGKHLPYNMGTVYCDGTWIEKQGERNWIEVSNQDTTWYYTNTSCQ